MDIIDNDNESAEDRSEFIKKAKKRYKLSLDASFNNRQHYKESVRFYNGENYYPDQVMKDREIESEPALVVNKGRAMVRTVTNNFRQNPVSAKVRPVDQGADRDTADILTGIIRHIEDQSDAKTCYENALFYECIGNIGFVRVVSDYTEKGFDQDLYVKQIDNPLSVVYDYRGRSLDGSDWEYCFVNDQIPLEEAKEKWPDQDVSSWESSDDDYSWCSEETVTIAEYFYYDKKPTTLLLLEDGSAMLKDEYKDSGSTSKVVDSRPYEQKIVKWCLLGGNCDKPLEEREWAGQYIPVVPFMGDVTIIDGKLVLQSLLYHAQDSLKLLSWARSMEALCLSMQPLAPFVGTQEQFENHPEWDDANKIRYSKLTYTPDPQAPAPQRQPFPGIPSGVIQCGVNAQQDLNDILNIHEASLGQQGNETSGRAIIARQRQGDTATYHFPDNASKSVTRAAKILVDAIPKYYDTAKIIRILGDDGSEKMTPINKKFMDKDKHGNPISRIYDLGAGRYDVVCSAGASFQTRTEEAADFYQTMMQADPSLIKTHGDIIVEAMNIPGNAKFIERTKKLIPPELLGDDGEDKPQIPPQVQQQMQQMQQQMQQMDQAGQQLHQELLDAQNTQQIEQAKLAIDQFNAETARMKVEYDAQAKMKPTAVDVTDTLTEAEKIQHESDLKLLMQERELESKKQLALLDAHIAKMDRNEMCTMDGDMNEEPTQLAVSLAQLQQQANANQALIESMIAALSAPKEVVRDAEGNIIGSRIAV